MAKPNQLTELSHKVGRLSLVREIYRNLLNYGRTYAAFEHQTVSPLIEALKDKGEIFDPMSGYGTLMTFCSIQGIKTYNIEYNLPLYLWQVLINPAHTKYIISLTDAILQSKKKLPKYPCRAKVSNDWYRSESIDLLAKLLNLNVNIGNKLGLESNRLEEFTLALIVPFAGRLSSSVNGGIVTHVKQGGWCVYHGWEEDYFNYLHSVRERLIIIEKSSKMKLHSILYGDARLINLPKNHFQAMITSPPYPNSRHYWKMFAPENELLNWLSKNGHIKLKCSNEFGIGSTIVKGRRKPKIKSKAAIHFLEKLKLFDGSKQAQYDIEKYYIPYYLNYFSDLELAYENIVSSFASNFEGYIICVNNTARDQIIPLDKVIAEIWSRLHFNAEIIDTRETFHVGTKNPRARGSKAKHTEYIIKIWQRN